jgi:hypothetical protein
MEYKCKICIIFSKLGPASFLGPASVSAHFSPGISKRELRKIKSAIGSGEYFVPQCSRLQGVFTRIYRTSIIIKLYCTNTSAVYIKNKVTRFLKSLFQALVTPSEKHLESNQKVQWRPPRPGTPLNLLIALQTFLRGSYERLKEGFQKSSYFVLNIHGWHSIIISDTFNIEKRPESSVEALSNLWNFQVTS